MMHAQILSSALCLLFIGCSTTETSEGTGGNTTTTSDSNVLYPDATPLEGESECFVETEFNIETSNAQHVSLCTDVTYATNPPSGGDHWPIWVKYQVYEEEVARELYVHNMEHGGVILLYKCSNDCDVIIEALQQAYDAFEQDAACSGPRARLVMTPDSDLDVPIAAAAWGATYRATCIDLDSLTEFMQATYNNAPESTCSDGEDPSVVGDCE